MSKFWVKQNGIGITLPAKVAAVLLISVLLWSVGAPNLFTRAFAANLSSIADTLSTSLMGSNATHSIRFIVSSNVTQNQSIKITLDNSSLPGGASAFTEAFSAATSSDILFGTSTQSGYAVIGNKAGDCTSGNQAYAVGNYNNGTDENLTLTICPASPTIIASGTPVQIVVGSTTRLWTNPVAAGSYRVNVDTPFDGGETRVVVLQGVTLTASVSTSFTFTIGGIATDTGFALNLATTTASTTATTLPFGLLTPNTKVILAQQLTVATNARNGFAVTVQEDQPPTSGSGATIDLFANGATTSNPIAWVAPSAQLDVPSTYGHFGVTSDDGDEGTPINEFANATKWAGNIDQPRVVFSHTGPADGSTQDKGKAMVGFAIQISGLQEADTNYTNTITYVATPTF